ncbi:reverse transcriptase domain-containing protein [Tanacetum coccineum]
MVDSQPMEEEFQGASTRDFETKTHGGPTEPVLQTQKNPSSSPAFIKENIDVLRTMIKEHDQQAKMKATPRKLAYDESDKEAPTRSLAKGFSDRFSLESSGTSDTHRKTRSTSKSQKTSSKNKEPTRLRRSRRLEDWSTTKENARKERSESRRKRSEHQEISSDSEYEEGSEDAYEDLNSPYKRPKPTPFTQRIIRFKYHRRAKLPRNIRVYEGNKDMEDHLGIFLVATEQEERPMPVWCKMFCQTLGGAARNWFDDLDPKSVDNFEELSQKFLEEFSQQKRYAKDPTEIHGIKRRQNQGLQAFMGWFKSESSHIKGVHPYFSFYARSWSSKTCQEAQ